MSFRLSVVFVLWFGIFAAGCEAGPTNKERAQLKYFTPSYTRTTASDRYTVSPPDIIMIKAPGARELDGVKQQIAPDGTLNLDLLGRVAIAGKTPKEIEDLLSADLMTYYKDRDAVRVHVDVEYKSQFYYVFGETAASGPKRYTGHDTLVQVLAEAQLTRLAWPERIYLIKPSPDPDQRHVTVINLKEIIQQGDGTANVLLNQDDIVYVPLNPLANVGVGIQNLLFPAQPVFQAAGGAHTLGF